MKDETKKMDDKTSIANFKKAIQLGLQGYIHLKNRCENFYLTTDVCKENGALGGMPIMQPYAFVRNLPETGSPYLIVIAKGKAYKDPSEVDAYAPGYAYIFKVFKNATGKVMVSECNGHEAEKVIQYMENNNYWNEGSKENSR